MRLKNQDSGRWVKKTRDQGLHRSESLDPIGSGDKVNDSQRKEEKGRKVEAAGQAETPAGDLLIVMIRWSPLELSSWICVPLPT